MNNKVYILHENATWVEPLTKELLSFQIPFEEWDLSEGTINLQDTSPKGIYYNRMSASSHTRGHHLAVELTESVLSWLESNERILFNNRRSIQLEVRKTEQYLALRKYNLKVPYTVVCVGNEALLKAVKKFDNKPFLLKPNRGGKGLGIHMFENKAQFEQFVEHASFDPIGGVMLLQEYIKPASGTIVRLEFIGGKFYYAVRIDATQGFELCPADGCQVEGEFCPADQGKDKFEVMHDFFIPEIAILESMLKENGISIGAVEYVEDENGDRYFYDINTNTNYNDAAERKKGDAKKGMRAIASLLGKELEKLNNA